MLCLYFSASPPKEHEPYPQLGTKESLKLLLLSFSSSRFTFLLLLMNVTTQVLAVIAEYDYLESFERYFRQLHPIEGTEEVLMQFMGALSAWVAFANIFFALFAYSRIILRFGVNNSVLLIPLSCLFMYAYPSNPLSLVVPIIGFVITEGLLYTVDDNNFSLLLNGVPDKLRDKTRVLIESFFEPIGMLIASLFLLFKFDSKVLGLCLSLLAVLTALGIRKYYLQAICQNLSQGVISFQDKLADHYQKLSKKEQGLFLDSISKEFKERQSPLAMQALLEIHSEPSLSILLEGMEALSESAFKKLLYELEDSPYIEEASLIKKLEEIENAHSYFYLAKRGLLKQDIAKKLIHDHKLFSQAALVAQHLSKNDGQEKLWARKQVERLLESHNPQEIALALELLAFDPNETSIKTLLNFLEHQDPLVKLAAAKACRRLVDPFFHHHIAPAFISQLLNSSDPLFRMECLKVIAKLSSEHLLFELIASSVHFRPHERRFTEELLHELGKAAKIQLIELLSNTRLHPKCRILAGKALGKISLKDLQAQASSLVRDEVQHAYFYLYHAIALPRENPSIDLDILESSLLSGYHATMDFIVQILAASVAIEDTDLISHSLRSKAPKMHAIVVETLEKACDSQVFSELFPLIDDSSIEEKFDFAQNAGIKYLDIHNLLDQLELSAFFIDHMVITALRERLGIKQNHYEHSKKERKYL